VATFVVRWEGGTLHLSGELDIAHEKEVFAAVREAPDGHTPLVVQMAELEFIDSTGIRALLTLAKGVAPCDVVLRSPRPNVRRVLDLVEIDHPANVRIE
jgi:anti-anti-sigma factor